MSDSAFQKLQDSVKLHRDSLAWIKAHPVVPLRALETTVSKPDVFTPRNFDEYIGQKAAKDILEIVIEAAKIEERAIPNILLFGSYGLGKTTLAKLIMERHDQLYRLIDGSAANRNPFFKSYIIIDEIHNLTPEVCDQLNPQLDSGAVHLIGCTTNPGELPAAFRSRLRLIQLEDYGHEDIETIIRNSLKRKNITWESTAIKEIAKRSRLNPREALQILAFALELTTTTHRATLTTQTSKRALEKLGVDERGLTGIDRKYLSILSSVKPTGLQQICAVLGTDIDTVLYEIEPYLLRQGLIERTPRGRLSTEDLSEAQLLEMLQDSVNMMKERL